MLVGNQSHTEIRIFVNGQRGIESAHFQKNISLDPKTIAHGCYQIMRA